MGDYAISEESTNHINARKPVKKTNWRMVLLWWFVLLALVVSSWFLAPVQLQGNLLLYAGLWLLIVFGFIVFVRRWSFSAVLGRRIDILEIPIYLGLTSIFLIQIFGLAPYFDRRYLRVLSTVDTLPTGLLLMGTGLFSMWLAYSLVSKSFKVDTARQFKKTFDTPSLSLTFFAYLGLILFRLVLISLGTGEITYVSAVRLGGDWYQWFIYIIESHWFFTALVALQVFAKRWPRWFLIFVLFVEATFAITSGWSSVLPKIFWLVFGCLLYTRQKLPWGALIAAGLFLTVAVTFSIPVVRDLRAERMSTGKIIFSNFSESFRTTWGPGIDNGLSLFSNMIIDRQSLIAQTPAILLEIIPDTQPYLPWQEVAVAPITFIPRVIWPSKPIYTNLGSWLVVEVIGGRVADGSAAVTMAGNAYMYGGWFVMIIGLFCIGLLAAFMYRWLAIPGLLNNQVGLLAVYAASVIVNFSLGEGDFVSIWQGLIQRTLVFLLVAWILCANLHNRRFYKAE